MARMVFGQWASDFDQSPRRGRQAKHLRGSVESGLTVCGRDRRGLYVVNEAYSGPYNRLAIDCQQCIKKAGLKENA